MSSHRECPLLPSIQCISRGDWGTGIVYKDKGTNQNQTIPSIMLNGTDLSSTSHPMTSMSINRIDQIKLGSVSNKSKTLWAKNALEVLEEDEAKRKQAELSYVHTSLFATILEDTAAQLKILVESSNEMKIIRIKSEWDTCLRKKYGIRQSQAEDELEGIDKKKLYCDEYKINKLDADRIFTIDTIKHTYFNICLDKTFRALEESVNVMLVKDSYRLELAEEEAKNKMLLRDLVRQLRQLRNHVKSAIYDSDVKIDHLSSQVEDAELFSETRSRFITNWQRSRTEQHVQTNEEKETVHAESGEYYKERAEQEQRVHMEVQMLMNIAINEALEKVEEMMRKYDRSMENIDLKIQIQKNDYDVQKRKREELEETFIERLKLMKSWIDYKDERERARMYRELMHKAAIVVQSWWRGLLVRIELGPFKPIRRRNHPPKSKKK